MLSRDIRRSFIDFYAGRGHAEVASSSLVPRGRSDPAVRQRRHGPVQELLPRRGEAGLAARGDLPEVPAGVGKAQRPGERRAESPAPHVLRDAGELLLRRLLQGRGDRVRLGTGHRGLGVAAGASLRHRVPGGRRGGGPLGPAVGIAAGAGPALRREGQLLGHGRHRALRSVQRDLRRHLAGPARGRLGGRERFGPLSRDLEPGLHAVRAPRGRPEGAAAEPVDRHRRGPGAGGGGASGSRVQLRHGPVRPDSAGGRRRGRPRVRPRPGRRRLAAGDRRSSAGGRFPARGRRDPEQRGPRLRAAPDSPPRFALRHEAGLRGAVPRVAAALTRRGAR